jgi:hypothetical protein
MLDLRVGMEGRARASSFLCRAATELPARFRPTRLKNPEDKPPEGNRVEFRTH